MTLVAALLLLLQEDASRLIERLRSDRVEERQEAARRLRDLGEPARAALEKAVREGDAETVERARDVLRRIDLRLRLGPRFVAALPGIEDRLLLADDAEWTQAFLQATDRDGDVPPMDGEDVEPLAARALRGMRTEREREVVPNRIVQYGIRSARPALLALARNGPEEGRLSSVSAFIELSRRADLPDLLDLAREMPGVWPWVGDAFREMRARERIPDFLGFLKHEDYNIRREALRLLGSLGAKEAAPRILEMLDDPHDNVRYWAVQVLADLGLREGVPGIVRQVRTGDAPMRREVAKALGDLGAREQIPELRRLLDDPEGQVRGYAAESLGRLGDRESVRRIVGLLPDGGDWTVQEAALRGLAALRDPATLPGVATCTRSQWKSVRAGSARALTAFPSPEAIDAVVPLLRDSDVEVRKEAAAAMARLDPARARKELLALAKTKEFGPFAVWSLAWIGARDVAEAVDPLLPGIVEKHLNTLWDTRRLEVLGASKHAGILRKRLREEGSASDALWLAEMDDREAIDDWRKLLESDSEAKRTYACRALARLGVRDALPAVEKHLRTKFSERDPAVLAAVRLGSRAAVPELLRRGAAGACVLTPLNALRQPDGWARLEKGRLDRDFRGSLREAVEEIARSIGVRVEWPPFVSPSEDYWLRSPFSVPVVPAGTRLLDFLEDAFPETFMSGIRSLGTLDFVLESDRLRVVGRFDAVEFWEAWWAAERVRK